MVTLSNHEVYNGLKQATDFLCNLADNAIALTEVKENIEEAVGLYLETLSESEKQVLLNKEIFTMFLEVQVA